MCPSRFVQSMSSKYSGCTFACIWGTHRIQSALHQQTSAAWCKIPDPHDHIWGTSRPPVKARLRPILPWHVWGVQKGKQCFSRDSKCIFFTVALAVANISLSSSSSLTKVFKSYILRYSCIVPSRLSVTHPHQLCCSLQHSCKQLCNHAIA